MHRGMLISHYRKFRHDLAGSRLPVVLGVLIIIGAGVSIVFGCMVKGVDTRNELEKQPELWALSLVGGFYLFMTGLWFLTRPTATLRRLLGLGIMLVGAIAGTWVGIWIVAQSEDGQYSAANVALIVGLLVHLAGVLYVRKE